MNFKVATQDYQVSWDGYQYRILKMRGTEEPERVPKYPTTLSSVMKLILQEEVTANPRQDEVITLHEYAEYIDKTIAELKAGLFPKEEQAFRDNPNDEKRKAAGFKGAAIKASKASVSNDNPSPEPEDDGLGDI